MRSMAPLMFCKNKKKMKMVKKINHFRLRFHTILGSSFIGSSLPLRLQSSQDSWKQFYCTWHSDVALGSADGFPRLAESHQDSCFRRVQSLFIPSRKGPCPGMGCPSADYGVFQQDGFSHCSAGFCGHDPAGSGYSIGLLWVSLDGSFYSLWAGPPRAILSGDADVHHLWAESRRKHDLREAAERADWRPGRQRRSGGVWIWALRGWRLTSVRHWKGKTEILRFL